MKKAAYLSTYLKPLDQQLHSCFRRVVAQAVVFPLTRFVQVHSPCWMAVTQLVPKHGLE